MASVPLNQVKFEVRLVINAEDTSLSQPMACCCMLIDGKEPLDSRPDRPLDALALLARGGAPGELYAYTCLCGDPGCAGFYDPWVFRIDGKVLEVFQPQSRGAVAKLFRFDYDDYMLQLALLEKQLETLGREYPGLQHPPLSRTAGYLRAGPLTFEQLLRKMRNAECRGQALERARILGLGELSGTRLVLTCAEGKFQTSPTEFAHLTGIVPPATDSVAEWHQYWLDVAKTLRQGAGLALSVATWESVRTTFGPYLPFTELAVTVLPEVMPEAFWKRASFSFESDDYDPVH